MSEHGLNPHPKRRAQPRSNQDSASHRPLEPFQFDASPSSSPQPAPRNVPVLAGGNDHGKDTTALDNLFHRFIHKQEQEQTIDTPGQYGKENKAGLERLFGNLDVLKQEDQAVPTHPRDQQTQQKMEDDALARLLGGLSTTPAPQSQPTTAIHPPTEKAAKLLSMLNPAAPRPAPAPMHQASLLALLSPKQAPPQPGSLPLSQPEIGLHQNGKPLSLPTSPKPDTNTRTPDASSSTAARGGMTAEERTKRQRALLEQITAGVGIDVPSLPMPPTSLGGDYRQASDQSQRPVPHPMLNTLSAPRQPPRPEHGYTTEASPMRVPPPSYDSLHALPASSTASQAAPAPAPAFPQSSRHQGPSAGSQPHLPPPPGHQPPPPQMPNQLSGYAHQAHAPPPTVPLGFNESNMPGGPHPNAPTAAVSDQQHNLLNLLRKQPGKPNPPNPPNPPSNGQFGLPGTSAPHVSQSQFGGVPLPVQGYRSASQLFPPQSNYPSHAYPSSAVIGAGPASAGLLNGGHAGHGVHGSHPLPVRPQTLGPPHPTHPTHQANHGYGGMNPSSGLNMSFAPHAPHPPNVPHFNVNAPNNGAQQVGSQPNLPQGLGQVYTVAPPHGVASPPNHLPHALSGVSQRTPPRNTSGSYHHPVPRPPNSQAGTLLGMLNEGR